MRLRGPGPAVMIFAITSAIFLSPSVELDRGTGGFAGNASLEYRLARALERHVPGPDPRRGGVATGLARDEKAAPFSPASRDAPGVGVLRPPHGQPRHHGRHAVPGAAPPSACRFPSRDRSGVDRSVRDVFVAHLRDAAAELLSDKHVQPPHLRGRLAWPPLQPVARTAGLRPGDAVR